MSQTQTKDKFNWKYFAVGNDYGGYVQYHDWVRNWIIYQRIMDMKPTSVLELGCARGYLLRRFQVTMPAAGYDVSRHAYITRVTPGVHLRDITETPWPLADKSVDVCYSVEVLDTIAEDKLPSVFKEIQRVSKRGLHVLEFSNGRPMINKGRLTNHQRPWWDTWLGEGQEAVNAVDVAQGTTKIEYNMGPIKINAGSGTEMFSYGWRNVDEVDLTEYARLNSQLFVHADLKNAALYPIANQTTAILASHLIDRWTFEDAKKFLKICWNTLQPGGTIRLSVPDKQRLEAMADKSELGFFDDVGDACSRAKTQSDKLNCLLHSGHKSVYDETRLGTLLTEVGFSRVKKMGFRESCSRHIQIETYDTLPDLSLYMEARKLVY